MFFLFFFHNWAKMASSGSFNYLAAALGEKMYLCGATSKTGSLLLLKYGTIFSEKKM